MISRAYGNPDVGIRVKQIQVRQDVLSGSKMIKSYYYSSEF